MTLGGSATDSAAWPKARGAGGWLRDDLPLRFEGRILPVDERIADAWGELVAERAAIGRPIGVMDAVIAAMARVHALALVTRNEKDFRPTVGRILDPWTR